MLSEEKPKKTQSNYNILKQVYSSYTIQMLQAFNKLLNKFFMPTPLKFT